MSAHGDMVVSGMPYTLISVDGRPPTHLDELEGTRVIVVDGPTGLHEAKGQGVRVGDGVRFHAKSPGDGKDVRVWHLEQGVDGFSATSD